MNENLLMTFKLLVGLSKSLVRTSLAMLFFLLGTLAVNAQLGPENFEAGIPATWGQNNSMSGLSTWTTSTDGYLSNGAAYLNPTVDNVGQGNTANYYLITPLVTVPTNGQLRFYTKQGDVVNHGTQFEVRLSTASQPDLSSFNIVLQTYTEATLTTTAGYEEKVIDLPDGIAGTQIYLAFVLVNNQTLAIPTVDSWFIDNVHLQTEVPCDPVLAADVAISNLTPVSATLNWTHPTATQFEIQVLPSPQAPGPVGTLTDNSFDVSSLNPGTQYNVYIKTHCASSTSIWAGPFPLNTPRLGTLCSFPIVIPDNGGTYTLADNLSAFQFPSGPTYTTLGSNCFASNVTQNQLNGSKVFFSYTPTDDGLISVSNVTSSAGFNHNTAVMIYDSCTDVGVNCLAAARATAVNVPAAINNYFVQAGNEYIIVLSSQQAASASIAFTFTLNSSNCPAPAVFTYKDLQQTSVKFSWDNTGSLMSAWEYAVQPAGMGAPTGAGTPTTNNIDNLIDTGLSANTAYELYVRSVCGGIPGAWSAPYKFKTQCVVFDTPYEQLFTGTTNASPAACWSNINANNDNFTWGYLSNGATVFLSDAQKNWNDYLVSPQINITGAAKRLRFKYRVLSNNMKFEVLASNTGIGVSNFTTVLIPDTQYSSTGSNYVELIVNLPSGLTGPVNFAWYVKPNPNETTNRIYIDDVYVENIPACPDPTTLTVVDVTTNTADFSWIAGYSETQWEIIVQEENLASPLPTQSGTLITTNPYTATNLDHSTRYEVFIRANCDEFGTSQWIGSVPFQTDCDVVTELPFIETFNDTDPETVKFCWTVNNANNDNRQFTIGTTNASISAPLLNAPTGYDDWLISPPVMISGYAKLTFDYSSQTVMSTAARFGVEVLISTTDTNPSSFSVLIPHFEVTNTTVLQESVYFPATGPVYIAFRVPPQLTLPPAVTVLNIDNVKIEDAPACPQPLNLAINNVTLNSVDVTWAAGNQETQWQVSVQPAGSGNPNLYAQTVNTNSYQVTNLVPGTDYEVFVRALCGDSNSEWIGPKYFSTLCYTYTAPFTETFNTNSPSEPCWKIVNGLTPETWNMDSGIYPYEGNQAAAMFTGTDGNNDDWLISPKITIGANQRLRYYYRVYEAGYIEDLEVALSTTGTNPADFTTILYDSDADPVIINNTYYKERIINLPAGITGDIHIAFHVPYFATNNDRGQMIIIDNVNIEDVPACSEAFNVTVNPNTIADTQITVSWEIPAAGSTWEVAVVPYDVDITSGIPSEYIHAATGSPFVVTGLTASTRYKVLVRAVCTAANSTWTTPIEIVTKCNFNDMCEYTFVLTSDYNITAGINIYQNSMVTQYIPFTGGNQAVSTPVFLCNGSEFELFFDTYGFNPSQYNAFHVTILNGAGETVWSSPMGVGMPKTIVFTGVANCGPVTCPQPTALFANENGQFTWTAGGSETQWEVAVQPVDNQSLPQSGTIVTTPSYTPVASDFNNPNHATYEYFVRAVCGGGVTSYWSGPYDFVRNNGSNNAIELPINATTVATEKIKRVSFRNATLSTQGLTCPGTNQSDVWFGFTATSRVHIIKADGFEEYIYSTENSFATLSNNFGLEKYPDFTLTLYKANTDGTLQEITCVNNNVLVASYASELEVGQAYKVRLTLNAPLVNTRMFNMSITTPQDLCNMSAQNFDFEEPRLPQYSGTWESNVARTIVPGWRTNYPLNDNIWIWETLNAPGFAAYSQGQCIQLTTGEGFVAPDPNDMYNVQGMYKDMDSSEITEYYYSFAHLGRFGAGMELLAGPPQGPFTVVRSVDSINAWNFITGTYEVPAGQTVTRFIFRGKNYSNFSVVDAANFVPNNRINDNAANTNLDCQNPSFQVSAEGVGTWIQDASNPGPVVISDPNASAITINGFMNPGTYTFTWKTRYCEDTITLVYNGIADIPVVDDTALEYCQHYVAAPLSATPVNGLDLLWFTTAVGGTGSSVAPTPDTSVVGTTTYYVSLVDANGCAGPRVAITVTVTEPGTPVVVTQECRGTETWLVATPVSGTFDTATETFEWEDANGMIVGTNSPELNVSAAYGSTTLTLPLGFTLTVTSGNCATVGTYTLESMMCFIPRGISPNGDGDNDTFDLSGLGVREITIFNRYGTQVYELTSGYTNQWHGQDKNNRDLPDGTYFYSLTNAEGDQKTGWVYINRQH
ncbi:choice-of-anchor J domain-containing protein [Flavobacterium sp.]|uniref:choice-of-anchor J domain-containing protein n=1 Tax=Flavobacterium sp. TaxID=239 RepID=UPI0028BE1D25|nr:choice-of-anchor J domain-containing protein [Flavobacterium sp.]